MTKKSPLLEEEESMLHNQISPAMTKYMTEWAKALVERILKRNTIFNDTLIKIFKQWS